MLCDACKKREATYHTIKQYNGIKTETHLCSECRRKLISESGGAGGLFSELSALFGGQEKAAGAVCPKCGTTREEFLSTGFVGCEQCYKAFASAIEPRLDRLQSGSVHTGKRPGKAASTPAGEYERLKAELKRAVDAEDYERAAKINLRLKQLRNGDGSEEKEGRV